MAQTDAGVRRGRIALRGVAFLLTVAALWATNPLARAIDSRPFSYIHPGVEFGPGWTAELVAVNTAPHAAVVRLEAMAADGTRVATIDELIAPGDRRTFGKAEGSWPERTAWVRIDSDTALLTWVSLRSMDDAAWD